MDEIKYSGVDEVFDTGAKREVKGGKGRFDLLPPRALKRLAIHFENGGKNHGDRNWEKGIPLHSYVDSGFRHFNEFMEGKTDENHLNACMWNLTCLVETIERIREGILPKSLNDLPWLNIEGINNN